MNTFNSKKFVVVMTVLLIAGAIAFLTPPDHAAAILAAFGSIATVCVGAYMLAQGAVDYKNGKGTSIVAPASA